MNIDKLKELSAERLKKIGVRNEEYSRALSVERIKRKIHDLKCEIKKLRENATYERDNFSAIDKREILVEEFESKLRKMPNEFETPELAECTFSVRLKEFNDFLRITGIIGLLTDPNYTEVLKQNADEIGLPELKDGDVLKQIQSAGLPVDDIDTRILNVDLWHVYEYDSKKISEAVISYVERILEIIKAIPLEKYLELNELYFSNDDIYVPEMSEDYEKDENLYEKMLRCYGSEIAGQLLSSFVNDKFYKFVNPAYTMVIMNTNKEILVKTEVGKVSLEDPRKIYAYYIIANNAKELEYEKKYGEVPSLIEDFSVFSTPVVEEDFSLASRIGDLFSKCKPSDVVVSEDEIAKFTKVKIK